MPGTLVIATYACSPSSTYLYYNNCEFHFQLFQVMRKQTQSSKSHLFPPKLEGEADAPGRQS